MSKASLSPTARLLQTSRLFSLPKPLPTPSQAIQSRQTGRILESPTATTPYPTHQAIDTPYSSRVVGEWGLKRHLPMRTTVQTDMPIRVTAQDTNDHVTDFASNGDLTMSLTKFKELSVPLLRHNSMVSENEPSVYENTEDSTDQSGIGARWKHSGPFIAAMPAYEAEQFLEQLKGKRKEWLAYLENVIAEQNYARRKEEAMRELEHFGPIELQSALVRSQAIRFAAEKRLNEVNRQRATSVGAQVEEDFVKRSQEIRAAAEAEAQPYDDKVEASNQLARIRSQLKAQLDRVKQIRRDLEWAVEYAHNSRNAAAEQTATERLSKGLPDAQEIENDAYTAASASLTDLEFNAEGVADTSAEAVWVRIESLEEQAMSAEQERAQKLLEWEKDELLSCRPDATEVAQHELDLRKEHQASGSIKSTRLAQHLAKFLDLPGILQYSSKQESEKKTSRLIQTASLRRQVADIQSPQGIPPSTHPGAGLGYLRSVAYMENHPLHGPQAERTPVLSRVVRPRGMQARTDQSAKIGLAGFVGNDPTQGKGSMIRKLTDPAGVDNLVSHLDPQLVGGAKVYMQAASASITQDGKVALKLSRPDKEAVAVATDNVSEIIRAKMNSEKWPGTFPNSGRPPARYGAGLGSFTPRDMSRHSARAN